MKRYAAFAFPRFYPAGGFQDFIGAYDTMDAAKAAIERHHKEEDTYDSEGNIADLETGELALEFSCDDWQQPDA